MLRAAAIFALLVLAGVLCHLLALRLLAWRGITLRRTRFGVALIFDTAGEDGTPVRMLNVSGTFQSACYATNELCCEIPVAYQREQARIIAGLPSEPHSPQMRLQARTGAHEPPPRKVEALAFCALLLLQCCVATGCGSAW